VTGSGHLPAFRRKAKPQTATKRGSIITRSLNRLSLAAEEAAKGIEADLTRRLFIGGLIGSATVFAAASLASNLTAEKPTAVSANGIIRTTLENYVNEQTGEEFRLVLATCPPGVSVPPHHHTAAGHNYVLEGVAESQYAGEVLKVLKAGESFQDHANIQHTIYRNPDRNSPLRWLTAYTVKKGQPFLVAS
jgi:quercetin dioxygenase-like cupin family protein